jgi:hypothetical protein
MAARGFGLLGVVLVLLIGTGVILLVENQTSGDRDQQATAFQHLVGGLGFGPALNLADCAFTFDPRCDGRCAYDVGPLPGGACFCPHHAGAVLFYPQLPQGVLLLPAEDSDAPPL